MDTINERVSALVKAMDLSINAFAKKLGKAQSSISIITDGRSKPGFELLELICSTFPQVSSDWLLLGIGEMFRSTVRQQDTSANQSEDGYLKEHIVNLEESFRRLSERFDSELLAKNQQIAGLQRTVDALVGKSESATVDPLFCDEVDMVDIEAMLSQYKLSALQSMSGLFAAKANIIQKPSLVKVVALG